MFDKSIFEDVYIKINKNNKLFFNRDSKSLKELKELIQLQNHRTLVMWALNCGQDTLKQFEEKYLNEDRPKICLEKCEIWARGKIKMPEAKRAILNCHAVAKEINDDEYTALCHAIGHAGATVHVASHAIGLPIYELTSIILKYDKKNFEKPVIEMIDYYYNNLLYWQNNTDKLDLDWAYFLID